MAIILIVDDDHQLRQSFEKLLTEEGHDVVTAPSGEAGLDAVRERGPDLVVMDVRMPGMSGLETMEAMRDLEPRLPIIIMTAYGTTDTAIEATKLGAYDYVLKPFDIPDTLALISRALDAGRLMRTPVQVDAVPETAPDEAIIGSSSPMQEVYKAIGRVAQTDATVLIRGDSGTGKELVARAIYQHSQRSGKPFLIINCVAIPETLLESELFGYEKGAFTGAVTRRVGKAEQAHRGTLFLDEIGDMPLSIQAKILRLLQEKSLERLGGREPIPVDVRIIAATNRNLEQALKEGRFREDLYYRLNVVTIWLPSLRERAEDIPLLADYFLARFSREMKTPNPGITPKAKELLGAYPWPGNVRELSNVVKKALIFSGGGPVDRELLSSAMQGEGASPMEDEGAADDVIERWIRNVLLSGPDESMFHSLVDRFASKVIAQALSLTGGNRTRAAELLGLSRPTLLARIEKYGLKMETSVKKR